MTKRKTRKKIEAFLENLERPVFKKEYLQYHQNRISAVKWLLAYYDNKAAATPEELLESMIADTRYNIGDNIKLDRLIWIDILYYWIKYKEIVGF
jgi:ribosomal protein L22